MELVIILVLFFVRQNFSVYASNKKKRNKVKKKQQWKGQKNFSVFIKEKILLKNCTIVT